MNLKIDYIGSDALMRLIGNDGVIVSKVVKNDGKTYYILSDGVEFCYDETNGKLIGTDGTEYIIDEDNGKLICNNGNDAYIVQNNASNNDLANNISNIFKGNAFGQSVNLTDVSPVEHTVDVKVQSKNIYPYNKNQWLKENATAITSLATTKDEVIVKGNDGSNGYAHSSGWMRYYRESSNMELLTFTKDIVTVSLEVTLIEEGIYGATFKLSLNSVTGGEVLTATTTPTRFSFTAKASDIQKGLYVALNANTLKIANVQFEYGEVATEYTPYMADVSGVYVEHNNADGNYNEVLPSQDGTLKITSVYPSMSIRALDAGAVVDVTYNRDINKTFEDISENVSIVFLDGKTYCLKNKTI